MGYSAPKVGNVVQKSPDPLINLGETTGVIKNEKRKQGLLSTFLQSRNRSAGMLADIAKQHELGNANV